MLWTLEKLRKTVFCYKMVNFALREFKFSGNTAMYFSYLERLASAKVEKVLSLQRNDKKVTPLLIYHKHKKLNTNDSESKARSCLCSGKNLVYYSAKFFIDPFSGYKTSVTMVRE